MKFSVFYQQALARKGGEQALKSLLPPVTEKHRLAEIGDDRYLSEITRCIFKAGFVWRVIENKWPDFEAAFEGFVPAYWQQVPPEVLEQLATDERIVRNMQKIRTVPENARMIMDVAKDHGSFGQFLAQWPSTDQVGLLLYLKLPHLHRGTYDNVFPVTRSLRALSCDEAWRSTVICLWPCMVVRLRPIDPRTQKTLRSYCSPSGMHRATHESFPRCSARHSAVP